jgi:hypothetical protein
MHFSIWFGPAFGPWFGGESVPTNDLVANLAGTGAVTATLTVVETSPVEDFVSTSASKAGSRSKTTRRKRHAEMLAIRKRLNREEEELMVCGHL